MSKFTDKQKSLIGIAFGYTLYCFDEPCSYSMDAIIEIGKDKNKRKRFADVANDTIGTIGWNQSFNFYEWMVMHLNGIFPGDDGYEDELAEYQDETDDMAQEAESTEATGTE